jgi:hypothetical protein
MSKFNHTPGPWEAIDRKIFRTGSTYRIGNTDSNIAGYSEECSNARLIAAAPDMLDALIESYEIVRDLPCECDDYHGSTCGLHKWERDLRGTIKKATGMSIDEVLK